jgi:DNA-binding transcriptional LysR family regulator
VRIFLVVVRTESALAASRDLGMTQTTVARRIDGLEHKLGICLFTRDFHLTTDAVKLVEVAKGMEATSLEFEAAAEKVRNAKSGAIRFT